MLLKFVMTNGNSSCYRSIVLKYRYLSLDNGLCLQFWTAVLDSSFGHKFCVDIAGIVHKGS